MNCRNSLEKVLGKTGAIFILIQTLRQWHKEHKVINLHDCAFLILLKIIHVFMNFDLIFLCEWIWCYIVKANCRKEYVYNHAYETHFHSFIFSFWILKYCTVEESEIYRDMLVPFLMTWPKDFTGYWYIIQIILFHIRVWNLSIYNICKIRKWDCIT